MKSNIKKSPQISSLLLRVANTILCNFSMTYNMSLVDGKMGVCIFLYEYARYTGVKEYEDIADGLLDSILESLHIGDSEDKIINIAGIGIGIIYLLSNGFIEDTDDNDALKEVDDLMLKTIRTSEVPTGMLIHAASYFIYRYRYYRVGMERKRCYSLAAYLVEIFSLPNSDNNDMVSSLISSYILKNAILIYKMAQTSKTFSQEFNLPSLSIVLNNNEEQPNTDWMWYGLLIGDDSFDSYKNEMDLIALCRECFYDAEHYLDILCRIGLLEIKKCLLV